MIIRLLIGSLVSFSVQALDLDSTNTLLDSVIVTAQRVAPTSLPSHIPTTMAGIDQEQIAQTVNATDSEDALKYFPSLLVRKRYIGDYNHAVLSSRASGTGNSARSAVYADGVLLSNYLGNGAAYAPRWMLVTPEEIERVDVMYGPFSAAYPGNSAGAVVDYVTRMPERLQAHAKAMYVVQPFQLYGTDANYNAHQESVSIGDRAGKFAWWFNVDHLNSQGQPQTFVTKPISSVVAQPSDVVASGAVLDKNRSNQPWYLLGAATQYTTVQDHAKLKLAYDFTPTLRASYVLGYWRNQAEGRSTTYLRDAAGNRVYSGNVNINGYRYSIAATDFNLSDEALTHVMHGLSIKSKTDGLWDYEFSASRYDYVKDELHAPSVAPPAAAVGGAGTVTKQDGTGWNTLALKGTWRPNALHTVDLGMQRDSYTLQIKRGDAVGEWRGPLGALSSKVGGDAHTAALHAQDTWTFAARWKAVLGLRLEAWQAEGYTYTSTPQPGTTQNPQFYPQRSERYASPKAALAWQLNEDSAFKASLGRAVRMPTVNELYGATTQVNAQFINDPNIEPEKSWTAELSWQQRLPQGTLRLTGFYETVWDSLYSDRRLIGATTVTRVVNVGKIVTPGVELALDQTDVLVRGLDITGSVTYADSRIKENDGYVNMAGILSDDTIGKYQPRVPVWRASALLNYRASENLNIAYGARYSGRQYSTLDNSDANGFAYQGASRYLVTDLRLRYRFARQWVAALGVDDLNNYRYWNFHPYPQRSYVAELRWDL